MKFFGEERMPVIAPYHSSIYSDGGYAILGQVLARMTGKSVTESFEELLWKPLGMNSTSTRFPKGPNVNAIDRSRTVKDSKLGFTSWGSDLEIVAS